MILLAGPSGVGKTTICQDFVQTTNLGSEFISGSVSDLLPKTKDMSHKNMLDRESDKLFVEDYQILNIRKKLFNEKHNQYRWNISDRSFLDNATYFWFKQVDKIPQCELEHFIQLCNNINSKVCSALIVVNFREEYIKEWETEDNNKRITSNLFQYNISMLNKVILKLWGYEDTGCINTLERDKWYKMPLEITPNPTGIIKSIYGEVPVLILNELDRNKRIAVISKFIRGIK